MVSDDGELSHSSSIMENRLLKEHEKDPQPPQSPHQFSWKTGFWRRFPHSGVFALVTALAASVSMIYIITASDGQPITSWKYQPTVCLAISYTIANIALQYALAQAVTIAWWVKALKGDAKVKDLHDIWSFGHGVFPILRSGRSFNLVALAGLAVTLAPINGPLLQRASVIHERTRIEMKNITMDIANKIPEGFTGISAQSGGADLLSPIFSKIAKQHSDGRSIVLANSGCQGVCKGTVLAAGYDARCIQDTTIPYNSSEFIGNQGFIEWTYLFWSNLTSIDDVYTWPIDEVFMNYTSMFKSSQECVGFMNRNHCELRPALIEYPIIITNDTIALDPESSWETDKTKSMNSFWQGRTYDSSSTHGGVNLYMKAKWESSLAVYWNFGPAGWRTTTTGTTVFNYMADLGGSLQSMDDFCNMTFPDPTSDVLNSLRELSFRTALYIPGVKGNLSKVNPEVPQNLIEWPESEREGIYQQTIEVEQTAKAVVFKSQYQFLAIAICITLVATGCVFTILAGWWHLGREVSLSPIEIAKAFNAPLLAGSHPNAEVRRLLKECGEQRLRYGVVWENPDYPVTSIPTLRLEKTELCEKPRNRQVLGH